jgi:hypothetical protein
MMKKELMITSMLLAAITFSMGCKDKHEPETGAGLIQITINERLNSNSGIRAYLFLNDSLYGKTDVQGNYENNSIKAGKYTLTCSAINFRDTSLRITIFSGVVTKLHFALLPDSSFGTVVGEFQDLQLFNQKLVDKPQMNTWNDSNICDGHTGATMYSIAYPDPFPPRTVKLDDSVIAVSDAFAQYLFTIQSGTYLVTGTCDGYNDTTRIIKVLPGSKNYINFFLRKK